MRKFIFILGGARSGKSRYATKLARDLSRKVAYIATCINPDGEIKKRIKLHRDSRPRYWKIVEEGKDIGLLFDKLKNKYNVVIIDCLGLFVSNLLLEDLTDNGILRALRKLTPRISRSKAVTILVSNEVGGGIVADNLLARRFRDLLGLANQMFAKEADEVIFMQSGIPLKIKGDKDAKIKRGYR
ncbi:bifunctional adenosylcobinamide kinase/adenosylcobinamide-phosphate guanylyltransferase [Patescibacteria group bacterium]|nr:bifunctional adenosylcobinamide kinase/adenosylcobinamide-phosphate guanylyltransferase [Patescibacteria group bacterium]